MRLFWLEIKRVLKSRRTMILLAVAIVLSLFMAVVPVSFDSINRPNADTRALNARKVLCAAPISMGRGETPVELCQQPSVFASFPF